MAIKQKKLALKYFIGENTYQDGLDKIRDIDDKNVHEYTLLMLYALLCAENLYKKYKEKDLSDKLFIDTVMDLKYKLDECRRVYDVCGSFVPEWFKGIFDMERFAHGRLQYDYKEFDAPERYISGDIIINAGDMVLNCHIPSSGPLTQELVIDSLKKAYEFNKDMKLVKKYGVLPVECNSWLLYPLYRENGVFSKASNTAKFADMFDILSDSVGSLFHLKWRVWGKDFEKPTEELPEDTSMQRNLKKYLLNGGCAYSANGILLFDGKKVVES